MQHRPAGIRAAGFPTGSGPLTVVLSLAVVLAVTTSATRLAAAADSNWFEFAPPTRSEHIAIYDPVRDRMLVFGGGEGCVNRPEVWSLSLSGVPEWNELHVEGVAPSNRQGHAAIYDPVRDRLLVFGGHDGILLNDVWALSLSGNPTWTSVVVEGAPPSARTQHSAIYDPVGDRMLVFGGNQRNDVWELSLGDTPTWSPITPEGVLPEPRSGHSAIYDPLRQRMLVFGGEWPTRNDVWALTLDADPNWDEIETSGLLPQPRAHHIAVYDPPRDQMIVVGGYDEFLETGDCWALPLGEGAEWQRLPSHGRHQHSGIYDPVREAVVVHGGQLGSDGAWIGYDNATWRLRLARPSPSWQLLIGQEHLPRLSGHSAIYNAGAENMVVFGGLSTGGFDPNPVALTWIFSLDDQPGWTFALEYGPSERYDHSAVFDPLRERMLIFGGDPYYDKLRNDTWELPFTGNLEWSQLTPTGTPPAPRQGHSAIHDPIRDRMLVFGGSNGRYNPEASFNDVWELSLASSRWTMLTPLGAPPTPREGHTAVYDPIGDRMLIFGGYDASGPRNDVWALSLAGEPQWIALLPNGFAPSPREKHSAIYDTLRRRMVVFGGTPNDDVWALELNGPTEVTWSLLEATGIPASAYQDHTAIYDFAQDRMVLFGGECTSSSGSPAVHALTFLEPAAIPEQMQSPQPLALLRAQPNPAFGELSVSFDLLGKAPTLLDLFDVAGRHVAARDLGVLGPGRRVVQLGGPGLPSGIYFVQLTHGGQTAKVKASLLR
jgi:hypothetical protein